MSLRTSPSLRSLPDDLADTAGHLTAYAAAGLPCLALTWVTKHIDRRTGTTRLRCACGRLAGHDHGECPSAAKHPLAGVHPHGLLDATADLDALLAIHRRYPAINVGIRTGAAPAGAGVVVVDVDPKHAGDITLRELERRYAPLPDTWETVTGSPGRHLWFQHPGSGIRIGNDAGRRLGVGVDIRGDHAYVVVPPSLHASGRRYAWELSSRPDEVPLAPLPDWLLERLIAPTRSPHTGEHREPWAAQLLAGGAPEGERNDSCFRLASLFRRYALPQDLVAVILAGFAARCRPPLDEDEVQHVVAGVFGRYAPGGGEDDLRDPGVVL